MVAEVVQPVEQVRPVQRIRDLLAVRVAVALHPMPPVAVAVLVSQVHLVRSVSVMAATESPLQYRAHRLLTAAAAVVQLKTHKVQAVRAAAAGQL